MSVSNSKVGAQGHHNRYRNDASDQALSRMLLLRCMHTQHNTSGIQADTSTHWPVHSGTQYSLRM